MWWWKNLMHKWVVLIGKKWIEDPITDGWIITVPITEIFFLLTTVNKKRPKASLDTTDIMRDPGGIHGAVLTKDYVVFKEMDQ